MVLKISIIHSEADTGLAVMCHRLGVGGVQPQVPGQQSGISHPPNQPSCLSIALPASPRHTPHPLQQVRGHLQGVPAPPENLPLCAPSSPDFRGLTGGWQEGREGKVRRREGGKWRNCGRSHTTSVTPSMQRCHSRMRMKRGNGGRRGRKGTQDQEEKRQSK